MRSKITLQVDGKAIPLNKFVTSILASSFLGLVAPLRGVDHPEKIEMTLEIEKEGLKEGPGESKNNHQDISPHV